jgi:hypothetical protein
MVLLWLLLILLTLDVLVITAGAESRPGFDRAARGWNWRRLAR